MRRIVTLLALLWIPSLVAGQAGDVEGEEQPPLPPDLVIPPAPALSPEEERLTFVVPEGFRVELVAAEPMVVDPVVAVFDGDGRLWVCEMRGYMPDVDGKGETEPNGQIAVLTDVDGDGRMDERTVFLDGLVLPRAVAPVGDGALVIAPPELFFARDTDGDGRADERTLIESGLGGIESPEHAINGLMYALDNWYRSANAPVRYRPDPDGRNGEWLRGSTAGGGQWGITRDDHGRVFYNTNYEPLRGDLFPSHYAIRNPSLGRAAGVNVRIAHDFTVHPSRINPGVNRGYKEETLRNDYRLAAFTGACAPHVHRGHGFPDSYRDSVYVCEPCGNLVKRYVLQEQEGLGLRAEPAPLASEAQLDFLTSTDERFRPVNLFDGPDGALYVVDFYRGIIQHRVFVTSFLRKQIEERELARPLGLGRIWRVLREDAPRAKPPAFGAASWTELVRALWHPNGWMRDTAQRILVEEGVGDRDALELLREALRNPPEGGPGLRGLGRIHASWALEGIGALRREDVALLLKDEDERVLSTAVRLAEPFLAGGSEELLEAVLELGGTGGARLWHQVILSLGEIGARAGDRAMLVLAARDTSTNEARSAVLSGLAGRELQALVDLLGDDPWKANAEGREAFVELFARCIVREGRGDRIEGLLSAIAACEVDWQRAALVRGVLAARPLGPLGEPTAIRLDRAPADFEALEGIEILAPALDALAWPGRPGLVEEEPVRALTDLEVTRFERGRELFRTTCVSCHQASGLGEPGKAPPLRQSPWVLRDEGRLIRILLAGMDGPLVVEGQRWDAEMPAMVASDHDLAAVLTYVRREWGHGAEPIEPETVARVREECAGRVRPWTAKELEER